MISGTETTAALGRPKRVRFRQQLKTVLKELGWPINIPWEEAEEKLKDCIVYARKRGHDAKASEYSEIKEFLRGRLKHKCLDCSALVGFGAERCRDCARTRRAKARVGVPNPKRSPLVEVVHTFVSQVNRPFFLDEILYHCHVSRMNYTSRTIKKVTRDTLAQLVKKGKLTGGGLSHWRRFELTQFRPQALGSTPVWEIRNGRESQLTL